MPSLNAVNLFEIIGARTAAHAEAVRSDRNDFAPDGLSRRKHELVRHGEDGYLVAGRHGPNREHIVCHSAAKLQGRSQVLQHLHISRACRPNIDDARFAGKRFDAYRTVCSDAVFTAAVGCWIDGGRGSPRRPYLKVTVFVAPGSIARIAHDPNRSAGINALSGPHHRGLCHVTVVIEAAVIALNTDVVAPLPRPVRLVCNNAGEDHDPCDYRPDHAAVNSHNINTSVPCFAAVPGVSEAPVTISNLVSSFKNCHAAPPDIIGLRRCIQRSALRNSFNSLCT